MSNGIANESSLIPKLQKGFIDRARITRVVEGKILVRGLNRHVRLSADKSVGIAQVVILVSMPV